MDPEHWQRVSRVLDELFAFSEVERADRLSELCGGDAELRTDVERLLAHEDAAASLFDRGAGELLGLVPEREGEDGPDPLVGSRLGAWRLLSRLGRGGMGVVYLAERTGDGFVQQAAVKLLRIELDDPASQARFRREQRILARLEHPAIARLIDAGVAEGRPFVALEFVEGEPLVAGCDRRGLGIEERLRLLQEVCAAVGYAHRNLVVHRDLKPANILLTAEGRVKLLDFGIARLLGEEGEEPAVTRRGERLFTPAYAAPEQLRGEPAGVTTDVYGLGLVLYELLCGRRARRIAGGWREELAETAVLALPPPPSSVLSMTGGADDEPSAAVIAADRRTTPERLRRRLAGDLDTIALMALRPEPERRYGSAEALAADLERHLGGHPVAARPEGALYRARKFVLRHRVGIAAAAAVLAVLLAGLGATAWQAQERQREARRAEREARTAHEVTAFLVSLFTAADPAAAQGVEISARELLEQGVARIEGELDRAPAVKADLLLTLSEIAERVGHYERSLELAESALELRRSRFGPEDPSTADALRRKGSALIQLGRAEEAESALQQALALHERELGRDSLAAASDLEQLAVLAFQVEQPERGDALLAEALETRRRLQGDRHADVARNLAQQAVLRRQQGELAEAAELSRQALAILAPELGEHHPDTVIARNNLAALLVHQGRFADATELLRPVLATHRRVHGDDHPLTVTAQNNLAVALFKQGQADEAEELFRGVLAFWTETAGSEHPNALATRLNLGAALRADDRPEAAAALYAEARDGFERLFGRDHPHAAAAVSQLAAIALDRGELERARRLAEDALARRRASRADQHPEVAASLQQLGDVARAAGDVQRAGDLYRQAWELRRDLLGEEHPDTRASSLALEALGSARGEPP